MRLPDSEISAIETRFPDFSEASDELVSALVAWFDEALNVNSKRFRQIRQRVDPARICTCLDSLQDF